jgi:hypothetical protein
MSWEAIPQQVNGVVPTPTASDNLLEAFNSYGVQYYYPDTSSSPYTTEDVIDADGNSVLDGDG